MEVTSWLYRRFYGAELVFSTWDEAGQWHGKTMALLMKRQERHLRGLVRRIVMRKSLELSGLARMKQRLMESTAVYAVQSVEPVTGGAAS